ncbi:MAG: hypothetical protein IK151_06900 [Erysipelotrichaceae bacterium]|nr:hypothetical protein [Erysipelotrichaceae bacterium]
MSDKRVKGCPNDKCKDYKKTKYKAEDKYCKACGSELVFVCSKCWTLLASDDPKKKICAKCEAKAEDRKEMIINTGKAIGNGALAVAAAIPAAVKIIPKVIDKLPTKKS